MVWYILCIIAVLIEFTYTWRKYVTMIQTLWKSWKVPLVSLSNYRPRYVYHLRMYVPVSYRNTRRIPSRRFPLSPILTQSPLPLSLPHPQPTASPVSPIVYSHPKQTTSVPKKNPVVECVARGSGCSRSGMEYEHTVHSITKACYWNGTGEKFNQQKVEQLGGSSSKHDLVFTWNRMSIPIEIKKSKAPDWGQFTLLYDDVSSFWYVPNNRNERTRDVINDVIREYQHTQPLFQGFVPSFVYKEMTHDEWKCEKESFDDIYRDVYIPCDSTMISQLYKEKNCYYMQVSDGHGLFHTGVDICKFGVPFFECEQRIRIRIKVHTRSNAKGFCKLSVMLSIQPVHAKKLPHSPYSLDDSSCIPQNLIQKV